MSSKDTSSICANCGKEGSDVTNTCNKCKSVMYCNAACKKKHRHKHKKQCERRVAELHDESLFKQPPPLEDCPICFIRLPYLGTGRTYMSCCGKMICSGCIYAPVRDHEGNIIADKTCPFCRAPTPNTDEEVITRYKKRLDMNDALAFHNLGCHYRNGMLGLPQNHAKALELWHRAGELGHAEAYHAIGISHDNGLGVEIDEKKARRYSELSAMGGDVKARFNLGVDEYKEGNFNRALKHWIIATKDGNSGTLKCIKMLYSNGEATKDDYTEALRSYQAYLDEIKSDQRDEAAAYDDRYKYYESAVLKNN